MASKFSLWIAAAGLALIAPAGVFMIALVARHVPQPDLARSADHLVDWYGARMWTLWLLLLALPFAAFATGGAALSQGLRPRFPFVVTTLLSAVILAIVVLHMAAN